jgi:hypothetical protein
MPVCDLKIMKPSHRAHKMHDTPPRTPTPMTTPRGISFDPELVVKERLELMIAVMIGMLMLVAVMAAAADLMAAASLVV